MTNTIDIAGSFDRMANLLLDTAYGHGAVTVTAGASGCVLYIFVSSGLSLSRGDILRVLRPVFTMPRFKEYEKHVRCECVVMEK